MTKFGKVLLADVEERSRLAAACAFRRAGYETVEVGTGAEALTAVREQQIALVMLEIALPDITGYEVCHELREAGYDQLPIFFMSATRTEALDRIGGLLLGADDFIVKPFDVSEVVVRARRFLSRRTAPPSRAEGPGANLTPREREVLALVAEGLGQKEIARQLSISDKTVATHIQNLLGKLDVHSRAELVSRAYALGLVLVRASSA